MAKETSTGGRGCGRGRHAGQGKGRANGNKKGANASTEKKFCPHGSGAQQQSVTFDAVKDHIVQQVQKTCKNGIDIAKMLDKEQIKDLSTLKPARAISVKTDSTEREVEQEGFDIEHKVLIEEHHKRVLQLEEKKTKAHALIFSTCCNWTVQI